MQRSLAPVAWLLSVLLVGTWASACSSSSDGDNTGGASNSSGGASGTSGGASGTSGGSTGQVSSYTPCAVDKKVGALTVIVAPAAGDVAGHSEFSGSVNDKPTPSDVWVEKQKEGDCRLITGPKLSCATACEVGKVCAGNNSCIDEPTAQGAGTITIKGMKSEFSAMPLGNKVYYKPITDFPPAAAAAEVTLSAAGDTVPAFSLKATGIDPLDVSEAQIALDTTKPLTITWGAPSKAGGSRVVISLDLAHHGNVAAKLTCDVADTGSATIPVTMLTALAAEGIAGFPSVSITRRSINSATAGGGCVEFSIASSVNRELTLPNLTSCMCPNGDCEPCTSAGKTCKANYTCG